MKLAFLGAGKIATAIAGGLVKKQVLLVSDISATDINPAARMAFTEKTGIPCGAEAEEILSQADAVIVAVKPQCAAEAVAPIAEICKKKLIISIVAGMPIAKLASWFRSDRVVRVMPNTPAMVGMGAAVFSCGKGLSETDKDCVKSIFSAVGIAMEMPEEKQDAITALSGSGPAYMFELLRILTLGAEAIGLDPEAALMLITHTMAGAAEMVKRGMGTPEELRIAVTSPGGTTAAGLKVMAEADFEGLIRKVLCAARDRSVELGMGKA